MPAARIAMSSLPPATLSEQGSEFSDAEFGFLITVLSLIHVSEEKGLTMGALCKTLYQLDGQLKTRKRNHPQLGDVKALMGRLIREKYLRVMRDQIVLGEQAYVRIGLKNLYLHECKIVHEEPWPAQIKTYETFDEKALEEFGGHVQK